MLLLQWLFAVSFPHDIYNLQWLHFTKYVNCRICSTLDSSVIILTFFSPVLRILITFVFWMLIFIHSKLMYSVLVLSFVAWRFFSRPSPGHQQIAQILPLPHWPSLHLQYFPEPLQSNTGCIWQWEQWSTMSNYSVQLAGFGLHAA